MTRFLQRLRDIYRKMTMITVPFDYSERTHPKVIPICIADTDELGNPVHREWVEHGVVPVMDRLFKIAKRLLSDEFRTSEIAEYAVHTLSRQHGTVLGAHPSLKVLSSAKWRALDLRFGGRNARRMVEVELFQETLDTLEDQYDFAAHIEDCQTLDVLVRQLDILGLERVKELVPIMLSEPEGKELVALFGQSRNTVTTRFFRGLRRAALAAGLLGE